MSKLDPDPCLSTATVNYEVWPIRSLDQAPWKHRKLSVECPQWVANFHHRRRRSILEDKSKLISSLFHQELPTWLHPLDAVQGLNDGGHLLHVDHPVVVHVVQAEGKLQLVHIFEEIIKVQCSFKYWKSSGKKQSSLSRKWPMQQNWKQQSNVWLCILRLPSNMKPPKIQKIQSYRKQEKTVECLSAPISRIATSIARRNSLKSRKSFLSKSKMRNKWHVINVAFPEKQR